jgi:hypothetical protein
MISTLESIPTRTPAYYNALPVFYRAFQDVDFFVEDEYKENLYYEILAKLIPKIEFKKIFPLGGKEFVIKHAQRKKKDNRKRVYIVDKDFSDVLNEKIALPNLFYLSRYSIENFVLEETAFVKLVIPNAPNIKQNQILRRIDFKSKYNRKLYDLQHLFCMFLLVQINNLRIENVGKHPGYYFKPNGILQKKIVRKYYFDLKRTWKAHGKVTPLDRELQKIKVRYLGSEKKLGIHVSGKYLIRTLTGAIVSQFGLPSLRDEFVVHTLAQHCTFTSLAPVKRKIMLYLKS